MRKRAAGLIKQLPFVVVAEEWGQFGFEFIAGFDHIEVQILMIHGKGFSFHINENVWINRNCRWSHGEGVNYSPSIDVLEKIFS